MSLLVQLIKSRPGNWCPLWGSYWILCPYWCYFYGYVLPQKRLKSKVYILPGNYNSSVYHHFNPSPAWIGLINIFIYIICHHFNPSPAWIGLINIFIYINGISQVYHECIISCSKHFKKQQLKTIIEWSYSWYKHNNKHTHTHC